MSISTASLSWYITLGDPEVTKTIFIISVNTFFNVYTNYQTITFQYPQKCDALRPNDFARQKKTHAEKSICKNECCKYYKTETFFTNVKGQIWNWIIYWINLFKYIFFWCFSIKSVQFTVDKTPFLHCIGESRSDF